ncbi:hypothetical protein JHK87_028646 [Glycine soja]|nr:hypothetical protein JHK87_028646 [Glycine soja]
MASIGGPQILLHSPSPSLKLKLKLKPSSSSFLLFPKRIPRRTFCSINSNSAPHGSSSIVPNLLHYLNHSCTQFHATAEAKQQLLAAGFHMLNENKDWHLKPGGRYFFTRNMSCLIAFAIGDKYNVGDGFHVIAAHTDSPCLKLKPKTASCKCNYSMVNVQTYGAGLWYTWFDRDLSVAGRVILRTGHNSFVHKLVKVDRPILRIPTLAIHLDRALSSKAHHHRLLMQVLSDELNCDVDDIVNIELNVCDTQPSCLGGGNNEFIFSGRLDNLASSYCALRALIDSCESPGDLASENAIRMVALFDNEEVGSGSVQGAGAPTMFQAMRRIVVSADMAHGVHPNFMDKHEELHRPKLQRGLVIKHNANQRYATSGITSFLFKEAGKIHNLPTQEFAVRNGMGCGSTIGPILASGVGIRTVDCGIAQLSMHSIREICAKEDIDIAYKHFKAFYQSFSTVDKMLTVDT